MWVCAGLLYSLEGSNCVIRSLEDSGRVVGKWDIDPGHDLLVNTRDGKTTVRCLTLETRPKLTEKHCEKNRKRRRKRKMES